MGSAREAPIVLEGRIVITRALALPAWRVTRLALTDTAYQALREAIDATPAVRRPRVDLVTAAELETEGGFHFHQGCLGYADRPAPRSWEEIASMPGTGATVVLDDVRDPDNVGSIFRSAMAFGARGVLLGPGCADPLYRKAIRTSMAATLTLPFADASPWPDMLEALRARGFTLIATTPDAGAEPIAAVAARLHGRNIAVLAGSEGFGLSEDTRARADVLARVPSSAGVDSLNVATAMAIVLYELD